MRHNAKGHITASPEYSVQVARAACNALKVALPNQLPAAHAGMLGGKAYLLGWPACD